jgi:hypothetical protein
MKVSGDVALLPQNTSATLLPLALDDSFVAPEVALASALASGLTTEGAIDWDIGLVYGLMQWGSATMPEFPAWVIPANIDTGSEGGVPMIWHKRLIVIDARTGRYIFAYHGDPTPLPGAFPPSRDTSVWMDDVTDGADTFHIVIYTLRLDYPGYRANRGFAPDEPAETYECLVNGTWPDQSGHRRYATYDAAYEAAWEAIKARRIPPRQSVREL